METFYNVLTQYNTLKKSAHGHKLDDHKLILDQRLKILYIYDQMSFWFFWVFAQIVYVMRVKLFWLKIDICGGVRTF